MSHRLSYHTQAKRLYSDSDFKCAHCRGLVSAAPLLSGVQNRNHCPYCLWSRHLDLYKAGDRLAACKATMQPVGLTLKKTRNKYAAVYSGELMLVHCCTECGKVSINRIAADDDAEAIFSVLHRVTALAPPVSSQLEQQGIHLLQHTDFSAVRSRLFGHSAATWAG